MAIETNESVVQREWFNEAYFKSGTTKMDSSRWTFTGRHMSCKIVLNPLFPDTIEYIGERMDMLPKLVAAYIEIDRLTTTSTVACSSAIESIEYLIKSDQEVYQGPGKNIPLDYVIPSWIKYMEYVQLQLDFSPDYTQWDKHTKEIERLVQKALTESQKVIEAHNPPDKRLPKEIVDGIYIRTKVLQWWRQNYLNPIRARDDYKEWKEKQTMPITQQSQLRRRRNHALFSTTSSEFGNLPEASRRSDSTHSALQILSTKYKDGLSIWMLNLSVYLSCAIIQAISFSKTPNSPTPLSTSTYLSALQSTMTQMLSAAMTYILTIHSAISQCQPAWKSPQSLAHPCLPVVSLAALKWSPGVSALLSFVGTAVTGFLQVVLVVHIRGPKVLP